MEGLAKQVKQHALPQQQFSATKKGLVNSWLSDGGVKRLSGSIQLNLLTGVRKRRLGKLGIRDCSSKFREGSLLFLIIKWTSIDILCNYFFIFVTLHYIFGDLRLFLRLNSVIER
jgi:hypothetical protein